MILTSFPSEYKTLSTICGGRRQAGNLSPQSSDSVSQMKVCRLSLFLRIPRTNNHSALLLEPLTYASPEPLISLRTYLSSLPTPTAITTSIQTLTRLLLLHTALQTGSSHLVLGTSLTSLAVSLISGVAQGAGFNIREETQEEWTPGTEALPAAAAASAEGAAQGKEEKEKGKKGRPGKRTVRIVRPLRDVGMKECAAWAWWAGVPIVGKEKWGWAGAKPGIGTLTKGMLSLSASKPGMFADDKFPCRVHRRAGEGLPVDGVHHRPHLRQACA